MIARNEMIVQGREQLRELIVVDGAEGRVVLGRKVFDELGGRRRIALP